MQQEEQPLVSIIVITYNSAKYVLETLESAKKQTYQNIEIIVSDDCSTDNTVEVCRKWIEENKVKFVNTKIVTSPQNTGISANANRGFFASQGEWVRLIAGDDILTQNSTQNLIVFIKKTNCDIQVANGYQYVFSKSDMSDARLIVNIDSLFYDDNNTAFDQYQMLLRRNRVSSFPLINSDLLKQLNGFDERFPILEDYPLWIKITEHGYKIHCIYEPICYYRIHNGNISQVSAFDKIIHPIYGLVKDFRRKIVLGKLPFIEQIGLRYEISINNIVFYLGNNSNNKTLFLLYKLLMSADPLKIHRLLLRLFNKKYKFEKYL